MRAILIGLTLALAGPASAVEGLSGQDLFRFYCAACHGVDGDGRGPMAPIMTVQPSDLTTLTERHGGTFPKWRVITRIDGRDPLVAHGSDMPVFGPWFEGEPASVTLETGQPGITSRPIVDLMDYLETIQK